MITTDGIGNRSSCDCCGSPAREFIRGRWARCAAHADRNPCAVEGCRRTTTTTGKSRELRNDLWLCGEHWRMACPPRSARRLVYLRFFRVAKRHGWDDALNRRFWRCWFSLVARARRGGAGDIDMTEINRLFGWK